MTRIDMPLHHQYPPADTRMETPTRETGYLKGHGWDDQWYTPRYDREDISLPSALRSVGRVSGGVDLDRLGADQARFGIPGEKYRRVFEAAAVGVNPGTEGVMRYVRIKDPDLAESLITQLAGDRDALRAFDGPLSDAFQAAVYNAGIPSDTVAKALLKVQAPGHYENMTDAAMERRVLDNLGVEHGPKL